MIQHDINSTDMDGTILNTEDIYTQCTTEILNDFGKGPLTWDVKIKLQGRPGPEAVKIILKEYDLSLTPEEFSQLAVEKQKNRWQDSKFLPGALELLQYLYDNSVPIALGTSSNSYNFNKKTAHLQHGFDLFGPHVVTGDDERIPPGRGKPHPDIWFACLNSLNKVREEQGLEAILIEECLIFEDGIPGVKSGIAANSYVIWIPDAQALKVLDGEEKIVIGNGGEILKSLVHFDKSKYSL